VSTWNTCSTKTD